MVKMPRCPRNKHGTAALICLKDVFKYLLYKMHIRLGRVINIFKASSSVNNLVSSKNNCKLALSYIKIITTSVNNKRLP